MTVARIVNPSLSELDPNLPDAIARDTAQCLLAGLVIAEQPLGDHRHRGEHLALQPVPHRQRQGSAAGQRAIEEAQPVRPGLEGMASEEGNEGPQLLGVSVSIRLTRSISRQEPSTRSPSAAYNRQSLPLVRMPHGRLVIWM